MGMCYNPALVRDKPLGAPACVKQVCCPSASGTTLINLGKLITYHWKSILKSQQNKTQQNHEHILLDIQYEWSK